MKKSIFVGGTDKFDLILYIAYILQGATKELAKRCLIVDMTDVQKSRYIVPTIELSEEKKEKYIVTYQKIDVAVGYKTYDELLEAGLLDQVNQEGEPKYDRVLIDVDNPTSLSSVPLEEKDDVFLTTNFDIYSIEKALEAFSEYNLNIPVQRVLFVNKYGKEHKEYLDYIFSPSNIHWGEYNVTFPFDMGDLTVVYENQRLRRMSLAGFSKKYKASLKDLVDYIAAGEVVGTNKFIKGLEKQ